MQIQEFDLELAAGLLGIVFAVAHGQPVLSAWQRPDDPSAPDLRHSLSGLALGLWIFLVALTLTSSSAFVAQASLLKAALMSGGAFGLLVMAATLKVPMYGRPTMADDIVRTAAVVILGLLAFVGAR